MYKEAQKYNPQSKEKLANRKVPRKDNDDKLTGKDFKTAIISTFNNLKENMTVISRKTEYFNHN